MSSGNPDFGMPREVQIAPIVMGVAVACFFLLFFFGLCSHFYKKIHGIPEDQTADSTVDDPEVPMYPRLAAPSPPPANNRGARVSYSQSAFNASFPPSKALGSAVIAFTYEELEHATNGFSEANLLGEGGFGYVYWGKLPNNKEVAVKQLKQISGMGDLGFEAEVEVISRVNHRHLVALVGYCITRMDRMLVYEFVPNKTLEFHLHRREGSVMDWATRLKIAVGASKGIAYLHEDCHTKVIHRDIKSANILLDLDFRAVVGDFGLAKFFPDEKTHLSTRAMGTYGYAAPEYISSGKLTEKSDVFSFGVVLLELITGRLPVIMNACLYDWARPLLTQALQDGNFSSLTDQRLGNSYDRNEMARMVACAAACVRESPRSRPQLSQVVRVLEGHVHPTDLNQGLSYTDDDTTRTSLPC